MEEDRGRAMRKKKKRRWVRPVGSRRRAVGSGRAGRSGRTGPLPPPPRSEPLTKPPVHRRVVSLTGLTRVAQVVQVAQVRGLTREAQVAQVDD